MTRSFILRGSSPREQILRAERRHQRNRGIKLSLFVGAFICSAVGIGMLSAASPVATVALFTGGCLIGWFIHNLTRPLL